MAQLVIGGPKGQYNKSHSGHQTITCDGCGYSTRRLSNLARHKKSMHERNIQDLTCCGLRYQNKAEYKDHRKAVHSKGYICPHPDCPKVFSRRALLHRHSSIHTGIREFRCHLCDYESSHKSNLQRHINSRHKVEVLKFMKPDSTCCNYHPLTESKISHSIASILGSGRCENNNKNMAQGENEVTSTTTANFLGYHGRSPTPSPNAGYMIYPGSEPNMMLPQYCGFGEVNNQTVGNYYFNNNGGGWNYNEGNSTAGITTNFSPNPDDQVDQVPNYVHKKWRVVKSRLV